MKKPSSFSAKEYAGGPRTCKYLIFRCLTNEHEADHRSQYKKKADFIDEIGLLNLWLPSANEDGQWEEELII